MAWTVQQGDPYRAHSAGHGPPAHGLCKARAGLDRKSIVDEVTAKIVRQLGFAAPGWRPLPEALDPELVFVVCPFDSEMEPVFEAIAAAAADVGLRAERVKDVPGDYQITGKILNLLRTARLIVADLSRERPNVYFELGYARGVGKTVITIRRVGTVVHFDVRDWTYIEYADSRPLERLLAERFRFEIEHERSQQTATRLG